MAYNYTGAINLEMLLADVLIGRTSIREISKEAVSLLHRKRNELMQSDEEKDRHTARELSEMLSSALSARTPYFGNGLLPDEDW